ncbi:hypothetical protein LPC10_17460 [Methylorubrum sp. B1-46]|uniref:hypothetical protein n=1 Tax=Methylorubrum TaxID=2282523 RepID=UPI001E2B5A5B|nr:MULTISPECIES: hypothetical protein [Methylorubrum]MCG5246920.1 hypothetical protein [Methylorubrum extorquens]UGB24721.1 hypothetical protein LPC10_17460 [Methylorubrum sp. B1-46]
MVDHGVPDAGAVPALTIDRLTPAVVEIRRGLAQVEGGTPIGDAADRDLRMRQARCLGMSSRLILVTDPKYGRHPLLDEAVRMRGRLDEIERAISVELAVRRETEFRLARARWASPKHG